MHYWLLTILFFVVSSWLCYEYRTTLMISLHRIGIDYIVYGLLPETLVAHRASYCWGISYSLSIVVRHFCHRYIVFGEYEGTYCASLCRTYATYSSSIIMSILSNIFITGVLGISHVYAWFFTMLWTGIYNYFMLKATWRGTGSASRSKSSDRLLGSNGSPEFISQRKPSKSDVEENLVGDYEKTSSNNHVNGEQKGWID